MANESLKYIGDFIKKCDTAFLSTLNLNGVPEARALANRINGNVSNDKIELYFTTFGNSPKIEQIKKNNDASIYYYTIDDMRSITLFGKVEVVNDKVLKDKLWRDEFKNYYPKGKDDELYAILKFTPTSYKYYIMDNGEFKMIEEKI